MDRIAARTNLTKTRKKWQECDEEVLQIIRNRASLTAPGRISPEDYQRAYDATVEQRDKLKLEIIALEEQLQEPELIEIIPLLRKVREIGFITFWETAEVELQHQVIKGVVKQIQLDPVPEGYHQIQSARIELHDWAQDITCDIPVFPKGHNVPPSWNQDLATRPRRANGTFKKRTDLDT